VVEQVTRGLARLVSKTSLVEVAIDPSMIAIQRAASCTRAGLLVRSGRLCKLTRDLDRACLDQAR
jgi:hypothetical protein